MDDVLDLRCLRSFVVLADELHFGRAAVTLGITQPALSQQVRRLEREVGALLLTRTSRSVALTAAGSVLLRRARRTLASLEADLAETRDVATGRVGSLRLALVSSAVLTVVPDLLRRFARTHPGVEVHLSEMSTAQVTDAVATGRTDAGVVRDADAHPDLLSQVLIRERYIALLPRTHPLAGAKTIAIPDLAGQRFVMPPRQAGPRAHDQVVAMCRAHGVEVVIAQEATHWLTIARLVGAGLGVCIAPASTSSLTGQHAVARELDNSTVTSELALLLTHHAPPAATALARLAADASTCGPRSTGTHDRG